MSLKKEIERKLIGMMDICETALSNAHDIDGAINWGDLHCVEVNYCINQDGIETYQFLIEEAAPENQDLQNYLYDKLTDHYQITNIEIRTYNTQKEASETLGHSRNTIKKWCDGFKEGCFTYMANNETEKT